MSRTHILDPWKLRSGFVARNRLVLAPMTTWSSHDDGSISDAECAYLRRRSQGVGIVITAACYVQRSGKAFTGQWGCDGADKRPSLAAAADVIHEGGALAVLQLHHGGRMCPESLLDHPPHAPSAVRAERPGADLPAPMTEEQIQSSIEAFARATRLAATAGYDGVEIHGANHYLLQQFFSPHSNRRDDTWGGDVRDRLLYPLAVTDAVLAAVRDMDQPFIVGYRLSPEEAEQPGITMEDTLELVDALSRRTLDWLHISTRDYKATSLRDTDTAWRPTRRVVDALASVTDVIGVGSVYTPADAQFLLDDGCAAAALGRILLMEPEWVGLLQSGQEGSIRQHLPAEDGDVRLTIPTSMYRMLLSRPGWLPLARD
ncbi:MAG: NADH-dependent flavin oxidoreductase [Bacteroidia bacterium]|nr:NADH-dependent flavin oxidoreductase [Bacteroidia bacterium]